MLQNDRLKNFIFVAVPIKTIDSNPKLKNSKIRIQIKIVVSKKIYIFSVKMISDLIYIFIIVI